VPAGPGAAKGRIARLTAARAAWFGFPTRNRCFREPDGQAPALAQGNVIGSPIRHSVPLLRDVMTAILVRFEWYGGGPGSGTVPCIPSNPRLPNDRSVQQGRCGRSSSEKHNRGPDDGEAAAGDL
jgi:hypothetical protein